MTVENPKKLGFGLMRLPKRGVGIDIRQVSEMVDLFMDAGCTYFDTAHVYLGSEDAARKALVERYPRESYTLATKLYAPSAPTRRAAQKQFETSLKRTGAGYIDYYLLHSLMGNNVGKYERMQLWEYVAGLKEQGLVRHMGFSFHDGPELLDRLLREHPEVEFVQLQINYEDWENPSVASRANYEVARAHGKKIVVMEPVKGGRLANPPKKVRELLSDYDGRASYASWAIRFVASLEGILCVLSGMSNVAQMKDNLSYMRDFQPLTAKERAVLREAQQILGASPAIPCTSCQYCTKGCPKRINIPGVFAAMNSRLLDGALEQASLAYAEATAEGGRASDCIACGQCERACPQHIPIIEQLRRCAATLEG